MNQGLINESNYCYLNATLQALFHSSLKNVITDHYCDTNMCVILCSPIHNLLVWEILTTTKCLSCTNEYHSFHNDTVVSLEVAQSLQRAMDLFFDEEKIDDYNCGHCHKKGSASKKFSVSKPPSVLVLHLKRGLKISVGGFVVAHLCEHILLVVLSLQT
ncbi:hypothetical protein WDU94_007612 [Cyamophila willieti]